jgi:hypothetical protein
MARESTQAKIAFRSLGGSTGRTVDQITAPRDIGIITRRKPLW